MRCPARLRAMTSLRSAGSYAGEAETGGAGAAAFAAQVVMSGGPLTFMHPLDVIVDEEGVRGKFKAVAQPSMTCGVGAGKRPGSPVEMS